MDSAAASKSTTERSNVNNFEQLTEFLLANVEWLVPAFGSHNIRSISHAMAVAERLGVPPRRYEFQMLYGMADAIKESIRSLGHRVRIYTPYGQLLPGIAYLVRRLLENSSNDSFLRQGFSEGFSEELLLGNPAESARGPSSPGNTHMQPTATHTGPGTVQEFRPAPGAQQRFQNEPLTDFSVEANRCTMQSAIDAVRKEFGRTHAIIIDNTPLPVTRTLDRENPSRRSELLGKVAMASVEQANAAVASCLKAFDGWRDTSVEDRSALLRRTAEQIRKRRFELSAWIVFESGKPWREADADVAEAIDFCEYYALEMEKLGATQHRDVPGEDNRYFYEPRGVSVVISPWNFPLAMGTRKIGPAVAAGCTMVVKPAAETPLTMLALTGVAAAQIQQRPIGPQQEMEDFSAREQTAFAPAALMATNCGPSPTRSTVVAPWCAWIGMPNRPW